MKKFLMLSAALAVSSLPLVAQQADATVTQSSSASTAGVTANQSAGASAQTGQGSAQVSGGASASAEMRPVNTELVGKLDSKSARAGDAVVVKTTEKMRTADGMVIPKGTRLVGHVAAVQAHGSGQADSAMSLVFDRAELKGGESVGIHSVIQTVAPPVSMASSMDSDSSMGIAAPAGGGRAGGGGHLGGGLAGGALGTTGSVAGGATSSLGATSGSAVSGLGATTSGAVQSTAGVAGSATTGVGGAVGATGSVAAHATAIPGVMLAGNVSGSASGTLTASRKNIHLDSGTQILMAVAR